jgi:23S rRNA (guanosine2251-2'-O)-methyltransferase
MIVYGINPVLEALRARRVKELRVGERRDARVLELVALARDHGVRTRQVPAEVLDRETRRGVHQGVVAEVEAPAHHSLAELVEAAAGPPLLLVLDGIEDPHNLGAILRTADAAGVNGVVRQSRRSASLDGAAAKASAGALAHVRIAEVVNIARAIEELKQTGIWTVGLASEAAKPYTAVDFTVPTAVVVGAEGAGLRRLVKEKCDYLVSIPMQGHVESLNVSVATGVVLFEVLRQRQARGPDRG